MTERCGERHPGVEHEHTCYRTDGHYDEHLCDFCSFDWNFTQWRQTPAGWTGNRLADDENRPASGKLTGR